MLTQTYQLAGYLEGPTQLTPFLAKAMNCMLAKETFLGEERGPQLISDPERFQLVANETVKIGQPVNRADALYWIEMINARAALPTELVGWVKVN